MDDKTPVSVPALFTGAGIYKFPLGCPVGQLLNTKRPTGDVSLPAYRVTSIFTIVSFVPDTIRRKYIPGATSGTVWFRR